MKYLIVGCNGMVGHVVALYLKEKGHEVIGYDESDSSHIKCVIGGFYDREKLQKTICDDSFNAVVNCTAIINEYAEKDKAKAVYINSYLPHFLESITAGTDIIVIHRSTDCIFSGKRGSYDIDDIPDAKSFYARTKAIGEITNDKDITIRTSLIGPEQEKDGGSLLNWFLMQQGEVVGYKNVIWTGLTTIEFAKEIEFYVEKRAHGLFQCVPETAISKYELLCLFSKYMNGKSKVIPIDSKKVDKSLVQRLGDYGMVVPGYNEMMNEMSLWIKTHESIYPRYYNY